MTICSKTTQLSQLKHATNLFFTLYRSCCSVLVSILMQNFSLYKIGVLCSRDLLFVSNFFVTFIILFVIRSAHVNSCNVQVFVLLLILNFIEVSSCLLACSFVFVCNPYQWMSQLFRAIKFLFIHFCNFYRFDEGNINFSPWKDWELAPSQEFMITLFPFYLKYYFDWHGLTWNRWKMKILYKEKHLIENALQTKQNEL